MQPFQFRLATLMRLRESWRDEKRGELAQALRADAALLDRLQELEGDLRQLRVNATLLNAADIRRICDKNNSRDHVSHFYFSFSIPASCSKKAPYRRLYGRGRW